jgi:chromosome segregation ATPase
MKEQQPMKLMPERQPTGPEHSSAEHYRAPGRIAQLLKANAQLQFIQQQTERLLSAQGKQMRERVKLELERLDAELDAKEQALRDLRAKSDDLQTYFDQKIRELEIQLAEKMLLVESRNTEVSALKVTVQRLSQQLAEQTCGEK